MVAFGLLGMRDDWAGIRGKRHDGQGLVAKIKASYSVILALITACGIYFVLDIHSVAIPGIAMKIDLGLWYIPIAAFIIVGTSHAVNLTDGLDGLAGSTSAVAFAAYGIIANLQGQFPLSSFCFVMVGALFAFLWFNAHPAQMFMGDTGALALGATLAVVALMTGQWLLLPIVGPGLRGRGAVGHPAGGLLQVDEAPHRPGQTHLQDGAAAPSFRAARLVGDAGRLALFHDRHPGRHVRAWRWRCCSNGL